jgi:hypothetical protein
MLSSDNLNKLKSYKYKLLWISVSIVLLYIYYNVIDKESLVRFYRDREYSVFSKNLNKREKDLKYKCFSVSKYN